jgi:hypothetical protein
MYKAESTLNPCLINIYSLSLPPLISSICRHSQGTQRQLVHGGRQGWGREREKSTFYSIKSLFISSVFFLFFWTHNEKGKSLVINIQRTLPLDQTQVCLILIRNVSKGMVFQRESQTPNRKPENVLRLYHHVFVCFELIMIIEQTMCSGSAMSIV